MIITDSGLHIWQAPTPERPWNIAKAHLKDPMSYEDLRVRMKEAGVDRAILVPPSFAGSYPQYSLEAAAKYPEQFAVMSPIPLNKPEGRKVFEDLVRQPGMLGVRLTFHHEYDESWIRDGTADWFWPVAEKMNVPVMMNAPSIHKDISEVAQHHPNLRLILDHMGRQKGMKDEKLGSGLSPTIELAKYPNVYVKLTSTPSCSSENYPYRNIHPHLKRLIEAFGPRRCFWGTDLSAMLSRTKCTYRQAVTMFTEEMDFLSKEDLEFVMGRGLAECLPWPLAPNLHSRI
jgi:predicted TIM-barrel fold metal-dependent hydrolase